MNKDQLLGHQVTDSITGFKGTVIGVVHYLTGCNQALVIPKGAKSDKRPDGEWFDVQRLTVTSKKPLAMDNVKTPGHDQAAPQR